MSCDPNIPTISHRFTQGDLEDPIRVQWNQVITTETSEIAIDRPSPYTSIVIAGSLLDSATGLFEYPWSVGDLVEGNGQLVKARLIAGGRRKSTEFFKINVDGDIT